MAGPETRTGLARFVRCCVWVFASRDSRRTDRVGRCREPILALAKSAHPPECCSPTRVMAYELPPFRPQPSTSRFGSRRVPRDKAVRGQVRAVAILSWTSPLPQRALSTTPTPPHDGGNTASPGVLFPFDTCSTRSCHDPPGDCARSGRGRRKPPSGLHLRRFYDPGGLLLQRPAGVFSTGNALGVFPTEVSPAHHPSTGRLARDPCPPPGPFDPSGARSSPGVSPNPPAPETWVSSGWDPTHNFNEQPSDTGRY
jgi:hypothetical protein